MAKPTQFAMLIIYMCICMYALYFVCYYSYESQKANTLLDWDWDYSLFMVFNNFTHFVKVSVVWFSFLQLFCCCVDFQVHLKRCCMQQQQHSIVSLVTVYFYVYMSTSTRMLVLWVIQHSACAYILCYSLGLLQVACHTQMPHWTVAIYK